MKLGQKNIVLQVIAAFFVCAYLSACEDVPASWATGEPDEDITGPAADRPGIERIGQQGDAWPGLDTVPERPKDFPTAAQSEQEKQRLESDYNQNQLIMERYKALHNSMNRQLNNGMGR